MSLENTVVAEPLHSAQPSRLPLAPMTSRILAAFVDYLLLQALLIALSVVLPSTEHVFLYTAVLATFYFTVGNSELSQGRTLGKRAFGLQVYHSRRGNFLSISESGLRAVYFILLPLLLTEIPPVLYRSQGLVASPLLLELPMLLVLGYTLWNLSRAFASRQGRAGHDVFATSVVLQSAEPEPLGFPLQSASLHPIHLATSIAVAGILWCLSVLHPHAVTAVQTERYALEQAYAIRFISMQSFEETLYLQILAEKRTIESANTLAGQLCPQIRSLPGFPREISRLRLEFILPASSFGRPELHETVLDVKTCEERSKEPLP